VAYAPKARREALAAAERLREQGIAAVTERLDAADEAAEAMRRRFRDEGRLVYRGTEYGGLLLVGFGEGAKGG
jgi:N-acetylmuramic acid 6-phosphate (MurNAc-6-P) etherase